MSSFSNLIDISSFFIGVLINLLLVALVCYYFKRKIDNLEVSQSEQAKMLYSLISRQEQQQQQQQHFMMSSQENNNTEDVTMSDNNLNFLQNLDLNNLGTTHNSIVEMPSMGEVDEETVSDTESESGSESGSESEDEEQNDSLSETKVLTLNPENENQDVKEIQYNEVPEGSSNFDYEKMTIKELKSIIENRGLHAKKNSKKQELIELLVQQEEVVSVEKLEQPNIVALSDEELDKVLSEDEEEELVVSEPEILVEDESELNEIEG